MRIKTILILSCVALVMFYFFPVYTTGIKDSIENMKFKVSSNEMLPQSNSSCEELIPQNMTLSTSANTPSMGLTFSDKSRLLNDRTLRIIKSSLGSYCKQNDEVGQVASQFTCKGVYSVLDRISSDGIVEGDYKVIFDFVFDKNECEALGIPKDYYWSKHYDCEIVSSSCVWRYCDNKWDGGADCRSGEY